MGCKSSKSPQDMGLKEYESLGWKLILGLVNMYDVDNKLESGWSVKDVDRILSTSVDIPRNINELNLIEPWARAILDEKAYINNTKLQKKLSQLRDMELEGGQMGSTLLSQSRSTNIEEGLVSSLL